MVQRIIIDVTVDDGGSGDVCILEFVCFSSRRLSCLDCLLEMIFLQCSVSTVSLQCSLVVFDEVGGEPQKLLLVTKLCRGI